MIKSLKYQLWNTFGECSQFWCVTFHCLLVTYRGHNSTPNSCAKNWMLTSRACSCSCNDTAPPLVTMLALLDKSTWIITSNEINVRNSSYGHPSEGQVYQTKVKVEDFLKGFTPSKLSTAYNACIQHFGNPHLFALMGFPLQVRSIWEL